jgi:hypothetical protein
MDISFVYPLRGILMMVLFVATILEPLRGKTEPTDLPVGAIFINHAMQSRANFEPTDLVVGAQMILVYFS